MRYNPIAFAAFGLMIHCPEPSCFGNALQAAGGPVRPVRIVRGKRRSSSRVPTKGGRRLKGGGVSSSSERSFDTRTGEGVRTVAGQRKVKRSYSRGSEGVMARLRRKVKDANDVPDLWILLRDGLPYLNAREATEVQLALAVSLYAHSKSTTTSNASTAAQEDERVKAGVEVCLQLGRLGMGRDALLAAILGGVLRPETSKEHSTHPGFGRAPVTLVDIREGFGKNVARLVAGLEHVTCVEETAHTVLRGTDDSGFEDIQLFVSFLRLLCRGESLRNLIVSEAADWQVLCLRLAVQLQALKSSKSELDENSSHYKQLARDALLVHGPLAHRLGIHQLRNELETVAFQSLFPEQFNEVRRATMDRSGVYENVVEATKATLRQALKDAPAFTNQLTGEVLLQHRIKSPYSMWKKMEKKKVGVEGVFDAVAIRVVLEARRWQGESEESYSQRSEDLCYQAMSVIQKLYPWSQLRLKDYIVKPKPNGYQSLHATQLVPDITDMSRHGPSVAVEFQVRSRQMHQQAEFGLAAHWSYKESHSTARSLGWISGEKDVSMPPTDKLQAAPAKARVPDSVTSGPELVDWLHQELRKRKVFVFGPDKKIWELDKGSATAGDVLGRSYMQRFYGGAVLHDRRRRGPSGSRGQDSAWVNGREVDSSYLLKNGDVFDVQTSSRDEDPPKGAQKAT